MLFSPFTDRRMVTNKVRTLMTLVFLLTVLTLVVVVKQSTNYTALNANAGEGDGVKLLSDRLDTHIDLVRNHIDTTLSNTLANPRGALTRVLYENTVLHVPQVPHTDNLICRNKSEFVKWTRARTRLVNESCNALLHLKHKLTTRKEAFYFGKYRLIWCPVYKAASSNVIAHFCPGYYGSDVCKDKTKNGANILRQPLFEEPVNRFNAKQFVVVRHPFIRLLSFYRDKIEHFREPAYRAEMREMMKHHRPVSILDIDTNRDLLVSDAVRKGEMLRRGQNVTINSNNPYEDPAYPTFAEFVEEALAGDYNEHWDPASHFCGVCSTDEVFDYIIKSENFDCEFNLMLNVTGNHEISEQYTQHWATNAGPGANTTTFYTYYSTLTQHQISRLLLYYQTDCVLFQYDCNTTASNINYFKLLNPNFVLKYEN